MIEQELQNQENIVPPSAPPPAPAPVLQQTKGPELFNHYEIKPWNYSATIYKILAGSAIFNILALLLVGQSHLLTQKGCDSPLVSQVCQVIDMVYVGGKMLGTDTEFVDEDYEKTRLGDDIEITYLDVSSQRPLSYPEGYFALANPEETARRLQEQEMMENGTMPGIPSNIPYFTPPTGPISTVPSNGNGSDMLNSKPILPPDKPGIVSGGIPSSPFGGFPGSGIPKPTPIRQINRGKIRPTPPRPNPMDNVYKGPLAGETAEVKPKPEKTPKPPEKEPVKNTSTPTGEIKLYRRPLEDLGKYVAMLKEENKVNLETEFKVAATGKLNDDGEFDPKSFRLTEASSPDTSANGKAMVEVARQSIEAINKSGYFKYLQALSGKDLNLMIQQDSTNLTGEVSSELESANRANSLKMALDLTISYVKNKKSDVNADQNDKDDLKLLENASVKVDGKRLVITFAVPKAMAQDLINRKLLNRSPDSDKPNATATNKDKNSSASK